MQGQRKSVKSIQIEFGSNSSRAGMDQPFYGSNMLLDSVEASTLAEYLSPSNDTDMDYLNMAPQETDDLNLWNLSDPNPNAYITNREDPDATKVDHGWNTSLSINSANGLRMDEGQCERNNILPLEHVDLNLNNTPTDDGQAYTQRSSSSHVNQRMEHNVHADSHGEIMEVSCPFLPEFFDPENASYSNSNGSSSNGVGLVSEDVNGARGSVDRRRLACKRKIMEGFVGESSTSQTISSAELAMPSSSRYLPGASFFEVNQSPGPNPLQRGVCSDWNPTSGSLGNTEIYQRSLRTRLNPVCQQDSSHFQSHSSVAGERPSTIWSSGDPSPILPPLNHSAEQSQPHMLLVPGLPQNIINSTPTSRTGSLSLPAHPLRRLIASPNQPTFLTRTTVNHYMGQDPANWNPPNSSLSMPGNRASNSAGIIPPGSMRTTSEMVPVQYQRNISEVLPSSLFPPGGSESGHQNNSLSSRQSGRSVSMQEPVQSSRTIRQGHSTLHPRAAVPVDRQRDSVSGLPLSARSRDGRSRMLSEQIRNALDLMRRGVNPRFEDVFIFDHAGLYGRADLFDRHRDLRLDVDNMSYEELLALEERIGYVNTGLNEETILKSLSQTKYSPCKLVVASQEQEPCCICREDYSEGECIGTLDCKHDFHTDCIKQWLMVKNLCPICKTAALVT